MFIADSDRIKSFTWADKSDRPVHTLNCMKTHRGPLVLLPGGRLLRAGRGSALSWTLDALQTHGRGPKFARMAQARFGCVASTSNTAVPAARYLGHAGVITDFSTSEGDANMFLTAAGDGYARLYDRRKPLPALTFDVEKFMFSGGNKTEGIKCWDVRAKKCVYELSTGNTTVTGIAWSPTQSTLYAATSSAYLDWIGCFSDYRDFHMPQGTDIMPSKSIRTVYWPDRAIHVENAFGYAYDAGTHALLRYAFKEKPELDVLPEYGDGRPTDEDDFFF
ncbi:uncharacterized protein B0H18DRAFT_1000397 [Fomitopsis serialis]|uniref:uncharacterized protein n=1 Tax=Fomitopsis serialis TaxID=139415 RepID=UPI0020072262|nr:uncharacterized protein B0H18DRAFT_1000397 [Neoantrodia serialis]KAH9928736.1 hypothetical protein B0H18DRAFT_1000397 [Neoantrodia serialis]